MTDNFRPVFVLERAKAHDRGPEQPQIQQFLLAQYGDAVPSAQWPSAQWPNVQLPNVQLEVA